jgi:5-methylcytosine-specific restriction endonuclease McrA
VLERAVSALLADLARKKFAAVDHPRSARETTPGSRHIPAEVKREVFLRDLGRCAFVGTHGRRCAERGFVEFHHVHPYALGGLATVDNIELRCRRHNDYEAHAYFERERP